jgi:hypothetical protein
VRDSSEWDSGIAGILRKTWSLELEGSLCGFVVMLVDKSVEKVGACGIGMTRLNTNNCNEDNFQTRRLRSIICIENCYLSLRKDM